MEAQLERAHVAYTFFARIGVDFYAQLVLSSKIFASELSRKFIKGALLVGSSSSSSSPSSGVIREIIRKSRDFLLLPRSVSVRTWCCWQQQTTAKVQRRQRPHQQQQQQQQQQAKMSWLISPFFCIAPHPLLCTQKVQDWVSSSQLLGGGGKGVSLKKKRDAYQTDIVLKCATRTTRTCVDLDARSHQFNCCCAGTHESLAFNPTKKKVSLWQWRHFFFKLVLLVN